MKNAVGLAVIPLRNDAQERALVEANKVIEKVRVGLHLREGKRLPYPQSFKMGRNEWFAAKAQYDIESRLIEKDGDARVAMGEVQLWKMSAKGIERFIKLAMEDAAARYDAFVAKLVAKVGPVETAVLQGNHVWGHSVLIVTDADGNTTKWKTQQIVNVSKLGLLFHQWPSRKMK